MNTYKKPKPSRTDLESSWNDLLQTHKNHLLQHGVKLPKGPSFNSSSKNIQLSLLYYYKDESIHKDDVSEIVREYLPDANLDTQVRHLKRDGWEIEDPEKRRGYFKLNPLKPSEVFIQKQHLDQIRINRPEFDEIKKIYDYRCATCGEREGEKHRFYKEIVKLEKGHKDPHVAKSKEDYIPQCQFCNKAYKDKVTFDKYGRVKSVANVELVKKAHESVKQKIKNWLNEHLKFFFNL